MTTMKKKFMGALALLLIFAAALLPAVGFGILLSVLYNKTLVPLFFAGFVLAAFTNFTVIGIAIAATAFVLVIMRRPGMSPAVSPAGTSTQPSVSTSRLV